MTTYCAINVIERGGTLVELADAVGHVIESVKSDPFAIYGLIKALQHDGFAAEQATLALYNAMAIPIPSDRRNIAKSEAEWTKLADAWIHRTSIGAAAIH